MTDRKCCGKGGTVRSRYRVCEEHDAHSRIGEYAERLANDGFIGFFCCNAQDYGQFVAPWRGREPRLTTTHLPVDYPVAATVVSSWWTWHERHAGRTDSDQWPPLRHQRRTRWALTKKSLFPCFLRFSPQSISGSIGTRQPNRYIEDSPSGRLHVGAINR